MKKFFRQKRVRVTLAVLLGLSTATGSAFYVWLLQTNMPDDDVPLWTIKPGKVTEVSAKVNGREVKHPSQWLGSMAFSTDGKSLITGVGEYTGVSSSEVLAPPIKWWDVQTGRLLRKCPAPMETAQYVSMSANERFIASVVDLMDEGVIHLWDTTSGRLLWRKQGPFYSLSGVAISPNGSYLVGSINTEYYDLMTDNPARKTADYSLKVWNAKTGVLVKTLSNRNSSARIFVFSQDGQLMAVLRDNLTVEVWDVQRWILLKVFLVNYSESPFMAFMPDAKTLIINGHEIELWDWRTSKKQRTLEPTHANPEGLTISSDGKFIASGGSEIIYSNRNKFDNWLWRDSAFPSASSYGRIGVVHIWDAGTGKLVKTIYTGDRVFSVAFAPDGKTLASEEFTGRVRLWDTSDLYR